MGKLSSLYNKIKKIKMFRIDSGLHIKFHFDCVIEYGRYSLPVCSVHVSSIEFDLIAIFEFINLYE